jgi:hypothetical protein
VTRAIVAVVADLHINSTTGLCPPGMDLDDGGSYQPSEGQRFLWRSWLDYWQVVDDLVGDDPLYVVVNGDAVDADIKDRSAQMVSRNLATILDAAITVLEPVRRLAHRLFIIRGTESHVGLSGQIEEELAGDLDAEKDGDRASWWQLRAKFAGAEFDIAHHASMGRLPWTSANAGNKLAALAVMAAGEEGCKPPAVVVRSHVHKWSESGKNYSALACTTPCWQLPTAYSYRLGGVDALHIGGVWFEVVNGKITRYDRELYFPARKEIWTEPITV